MSTIFGHLAGKEGSLRLSNNPRKGKVVRVENDKGWIQPEGERTRVFFRQDRIRAVVLNEQGEPVFGAKSTRHGQQKVSEGEDVMFLDGEDDHDRRRVHAFARFTDWEQIRIVGQHQTTTTSTESTE